VPNFKGKRFQEYKTLFYAGCSVSEIASLCGVTRQAVSLGLHYIGITKEEINASRRQRTQSRHVAIAEMAQTITAQTYKEAAEIICDNTGLTKSSVAQILGIQKVPLLKQIDPLIGSIKGHWLIQERANLPGKPIHYKCRCLICNKIFVVNKRNILKGLSSSCLICGVKLREERKKQRKQEKHNG
jgi:predicted transcriptional regulator